MLFTGYITPGISRPNHQSYGYRFFWPVTNLVFSEVAGENSETETLHLVCKVAYSLKLHFPSSGGFR